MRAACPRSASAPARAVGLCVERSVDLVAGVLGILRAGGAYVPLDPIYPAERLGLLIEDTRAPVVLTQLALRDRLPPVGARIVCVDDAETAAWPAGDHVRSRPDNAAYTIYTSGSTGTPKGVVITHQQVVDLLQGMRPLFGFDDNEVWTLFHSISFDFSVWEMWGALAHGGRLVIVPQETTRSPEALVELVAGEKVTVLCQTPAAFREFMRAEAADGRDLAYLRHVILGGDSLEPERLRPWLDRYGADRPRLTNLYGITETTVVVTAHPISRADLEPGRGSVIGRPIPGLRVHLLDRRGQPVPVGVVGEIHVGGRAVARGYLGRPALTAERFVPDPFGGPGERLYRSGDLARYLASGELEYLGRADHQVKVRGFRIEPGEIEAALLAHPAVGECVVVARDGSGNGARDGNGNGRRRVAGDRRLVAYLVAGAAELPEPAALRSHLSARLPDHMVPSTFVALDRLPLTPQGKVDRAALPAPSRASPTPARRIRRPRSSGRWPPSGARCSRWTGSGCATTSSTSAATRCAPPAGLARARRLGVELPVRAVFEARTLPRWPGAVESTLVTADLALRDWCRARAAARFRSRSRSSGSGSSSRWSRAARSTTCRPPSAWKARSTARRSSEPRRGRRRRHEVLRTASGRRRRTAAPGHRDRARRSASTDLLRQRRAGAGGRAHRRREEARRGFDLARGPLARARLLRLGETCTSCARPPPRGVCDGWSMGLWCARPRRSTLVRRRRPVAPARELRLQYADFASWQRDALDSGALDEQLAYWRAELAGSAPLELPGDRPRPPRPSLRGGGSRSRCRRRSSAGAAAALARAEGATPFMALLAGLAALLHRMTGQEDLCVGTPVAERTARRDRAAHRLLRQHGGPARRPVGRPELPPAPRPACATRRSAPSPIRTSRSSGWSRSWRRAASAAASRCSRRCS